VTDADQLLWLCSAQVRARIVAAGMLAEIWLAIGGFGIWWFLPPYNIISVLAALLVILSLTRLIFRLNPLMRSDGYWLLSHYWDMRQLHSQAIAYLKNWKHRHKNVDPRQKQEERRYISYLLGSILCSGIMAYLAGSALWSRLLYGSPLLRFYTAVILIVMFITLLPPDWKQFSWIKESNNRDKSSPNK
jgi:putative peptide zinc metalloprotease protein